MKPIQHNSNNFVFEPPHGMSPEQCVPLACTLIQYEDGARGIMSFWKPTAEELMMLQNGQHVIVTVMGTQMPPINVEVGS